MIMGSEGKGEPDLKSFSILASWLETMPWKDESAVWAPSALPSCASHSSDGVHCRKTSPTIQAQKCLWAGMQARAQPSCEGHQH